MINMRKKKLYLNTVSSLANQIVVLFCGFILPRFILQTFGSDINGLVSSIMQYLGFITLLDAGVGAVIQSAYYQPLANDDYKTISLLFNYSKKFYRVLASILICYVVFLCNIFPYLINYKFNTSFIISLIIIISFSLFSQFFFAAPQQLLLNADQKLYIQTNIQTITLILNTVISVILITTGHSIQIVKLVPSIIFFSTPLFLSFYIKRHYELNYTLKDRCFKIEQKWNGFAQHCATVVMNNTDIMVLTILAPLSDVSIYAVYNLVVYGIRQLMSSISSGFNSLLGNILACNEKKLLYKIFGLFEWFMHSIVVLFFSMTGILIVPFIENYTSGISDARYYQPTFAALLTLAQAIYCIRIPYNAIICAAGHYKQTQKSAIIEMILNLSISVILVHKVSLIGVAIGTLIAMMYRTGYFIFYLHKNILEISYKTVFKQIISDFIQSFAIIFANNFLLKNLSSGNSYLRWIMHATILGGLSVIIVFIYNIVFYKNNIKSISHVFIKNNNVGKMDGAKDQDNLS
ncbi:polysaccharide biosynthesis C-terminal domain-containing protein [Cloacibacillus evryensis]